MTERDRSKSSSLENEKDKKSDLPFGRMKNYLIATAAGLVTGPYFIISLFTFGLIDKSEATKKLSNKKKWYAWAGIGTVTSPFLIWLMIAMGENDKRTASIDASIQEINNIPVTRNNYIEKNTMIIQLLRDQCYKDVPDDKCMNLGNMQTHLTNRQTNDLEPTLQAINSQIKTVAAEKEARAAKIARLERANQLREKSNIDSGDSWSLEDTIKQYKVFYRMCTAQGMGHGDAKDCAKRSLDSKGFNSYKISDRVARQVRIEVRGS